MLKNEIESASGIYEALGNFAIYIGESIDNNEIDDVIMQKVVQFMDELASYSDAELKNILVVGIFETLDNYEKAIDYIKQRICSEGIQLYNKYVA